MDKVLHWCQTHALFSPGDHVTAALSGGADSMAMLFLLLQLRAPLGITIQAAHYNHHLRGAESDRDEEFCRNICAAHQIAFICGGGDVSAEAARTGDSLELAARNMRYDFLLSVSGSGKLATAHTADDNLETLLLNLTRGTALRGLCGIPPVRGSIVRPILCLTRQEVESFLTGCGLDYVTDSTNHSNHCRRNRVRHITVPSLTNENPSLAHKTLALTEALRQDELYLQSLADTLLDSAHREDGFDLDTLRNAPDVIRRRALRRLLERSGAQNVVSAHLNAVDHLLRSESASARLELPGCTLHRQYNRLRLGDAQDFASFDPFLLPMPGRTTFLNGCTLVCTGPTPFSAVPDDDALYVTLLTAPLVRPRQSGDRLRLSGGTKSLKALMIDRKIPAASRGVIPVLELDGRVIAACSVGVDPAYRPEPGQLCFKLQFSRAAERRVADDSPI